MKKAIYLVLILAFCIIAFPSKSLAVNPPESFADLAEKLMPAVVNISSIQKIEVSSKKNPLRRFPEGSPFEGFNRFLKEFGGPKFNPRLGNRKTTSLGSGFFISSDGYIVSNNHVIKNADEITVTYGAEGEFKAEVEVVGTDPKTDLALLKIKGEVKESLPFVKFGDSNKSRIGDWILVIGNPFGLGGTVTAGIISARGRDINAGPFDDFIQSDAAINKGNSGGPMFNLDGEVIGINTAIFSPNGGGNVGIGFAIPASIAENIIKQLKDNGKIQRGWLGVKIQHITEEIAESIGLKDEHGALVAEVMEDSPAEKGGIRIGDIILKFDEKKVSVMKKLPLIVAETTIGKRVNVELLRNGKKKVVKITTGELDEGTEGKTSSGNEKNENSSAILGMTLVPLDNKVRKEYGLDEGVSGLLVKDLNINSIAVLRGINKGDVIKKINHDKATTVGNFLKTIENARKKGRKSVLFLILRDNDTMFLAVPITEEE